MKEQLSLSEMVQNAIGESVTPSRLKKSKEPCSLLESFLFDTTIPGPFHSNLRPGECPHYLFRDGEGVQLIIHEEEFPHSDERSTNTKGKIKVRVVVLITDQRSILFYRGENVQKHISLEHNDLINIEFKSGIVNNGIVLETAQRSVEISVIGSSFDSEVSDANAYISDNSGVESETSGFDFEGDDVDSVKSALNDQLSKLDGLREKIDIWKVVSKAGIGGKLGIKGGKVGLLLGIVTYGGIEIHNQLNESDDPDTSIEDINPDETAEEIAKWQKVGKSSDYDGMMLASSTLGAAISVDKQTSGSEVSRVLSDLDLDMVSRQLEDGKQKDAALQVASEAVEAYSAELSWLIEQAKSGDGASN